MGNQWFEEFEVGQRFVSQGVTFTEASIIDFASRYDPQRFHIDKEAAARTPFGGLVASGFQTLGLSFRMFFELGVIRESGIGAPGIEELRWTAPGASRRHRVRRGRGDRSEAVEIESRSRDRANTLHHPEPARGDGHDPARAADRRAAPDRLTTVRGHEHRFSGTRRIA